MVLFSDRMSAFDFKFDCYIIYFCILSLSLHITKRLRIWKMSLGIVSS